MDYELRIRQAPERDVQEYMQVLGISRILASCLINQGIDIDTAEAILDINYDGIHQPLAIKDIGTAALLLHDYLVRPKAVIYVFADYDADGITSAAIACKGLHKLKESINPEGDVKILYYVPERAEGYGLSVAFAESLCKTQDPDYPYLVVTVDNGITAKPAVDILKAGGIEVLVTDHHQPDFENGLTPIDQCLCIDPHLEPYSDGELLAGCGVILNVLQATEEICGLDHSITDSLHYLAAIGIIGDMMKIDIYHACLVQSGLAQLNAVPSVLWVDEMKRHTKIPKFTAKDIGFTLAPILNSCGQMGHANWAIQLLLSTDTEEIRRMADKIHTLYEDNRDETKSLKQAAERDIASYIGEHRFILYPLRTEHTGLASKVATHLGKQIGLPIILWTENQENAKEELLKGSARNDTAIPAMQFVKEAVAAGLLGSAEGHKYAFGVSLYRSKLKELQEFLDQTMIEYEKKVGPCKPSSSTLSVDCIISSGDINVKNMRDIEQIPFAKNLEAPVVMVRGATIKNVKVSQNNPKNVCYTVQSAGSMRPIDIWAWNIKPDQYKPGIHTKIDLVGTIERNFMRPDYATLNVMDINCY